MIIHIIPETLEEKRDLEEVEHMSVKNVFICGTKENPDGQLEDFHIWRGDYRFLLSDLSYYQTAISNERRAKTSLSPNVLSQVTEDGKMIKRGGVDEPNLKILSAEEDIVSAEEKEEKEEKKEKKDKKEEK